MKKYTDSGMERKKEAKIEQNIKDVKRIFFK